MARAWNLHAYCSDPHASTDLKFAMTLTAPTSSPADAAIADMSLSSHYQPIFGLAHRHIIGFEALLRGQRDEASLAPQPLFAEAKSLGTADDLDQASFEQHLARFSAGSSAGNWLFVNVLPESFLNRHVLEWLPVALSKSKLAPDSLVIEISAGEGHDLTMHRQTVKDLRALGCLVALDDFGAKECDVAVVWRLQPDIVKLAPTLLHEASKHPRQRTMLTGLVSLLHDAGALVVIEGVETEQQALIALESDCDFVQGFYFGTPQPDFALIREQSEVFDRLWDAYRQFDLDTTSAQRNRLAPYVEAFRQIPTRMMMNGHPLPTAADPFLSLPASALCFVLDEEGRQIGEGLPGCFSRESRTRLHRLQETAGASWVRRPYFRDAMHTLGELQVSRPYLSASTGRFCVTLSIAFETGGRCVVLCGDLDWDAAVGS